MVSISASSDGVANKFDLLTQYEGKVTRYKALDISYTGADNLETVLGDDDANVITATKVANSVGVPALAWTPLLSSSAGTIADSDYTSTSRGYTVAANTGATRSGTITIAGQTFTVNQDAAPPQCSYQISPTSATFKRKGGTGSISVSASSVCGWTAVSNASWITITSGASGSGNGSVSYSLSTNRTGRSRNGTITIAGQTFAVKQKS